MDFFSEKVGVSPSQQTPFETSSRLGKKKKKYVVFPRAGTVYAYTAHYGTLNRDPCASETSNVWDVVQVAFAVGACFLP